MNEPDLELILSKVTKRGFQQVALEYRKTHTEQVRFSRNSQDLHNDWDESWITIFAATERKTVSTGIGTMRELDETVERLWKLSGEVPENNAFNGINPEKTSLRDTPDFRDNDYDLQDISENLINSATDNGAERTAGVVYNRNHQITVKTNFNECTFNTGGIEVLIRSFKGEQTGQEARHFGKGIKVDSDLIGSIGAQSASTLTNTETISSIDPGKWKVLMSPYVIGNIISYSSDFLSYYSIENGLSCFSGLLGKEVSHNNFNLVDDPLDRDGTGFRLCDEEGSPARKNTLIENGTLKSYLHSFSTSRKMETESTGNAGILIPKAWQLKIQPGYTTQEEVLSNIDEGLWINNCWYTRYQDYRNGIFSTVPRDGVFYVKNGEIQGNVKGIRISDSVPSILKNISAVASDSKSVKWWEEISPSYMPSVLVDRVNISRGF